MDRIVHIGHTVSDATGFGETIRRRRKSLGYTQVKIADLCGTGVRFISDLENGKRTVELGKAFLVAATLGLDILVRARGERLERGEPE